MTNMTGTRAVQWCLRITAAVITNSTEMMTQMPTILKNHLERRQIPCALVPGRLDRCVAAGLHGVRS